MCRHVCHENTRPHYQLTTLLYLYMGSLIPGGEDVGKKCWCGDAFGKCPHSTTKQEEITLNAQVIALWIADHESEIRQMGFASSFLEAIENSINKLVTKKQIEVLEDLNQKLSAEEKDTMTWGDEGGHAFGWAIKFVEELRARIIQQQKVSSPKD